MLQAVSKNIVFESWLHSEIESGGARPNFKHHRGNAARRADLVMTSQGIYDVIKVKKRPVRTAAATAARNSHTFGDDNFLVLLT